jgi:hypothetical protein
MQITVQITRILGEVFVRSKLRGVDEDAHGYVVTFSFGAAGKGDMPFVEITHRRDKPQLPVEKEAGGA